MIRETLASLAGKKKGLKSELFTNREKIRGISEILPDLSEIKEYALSLITVQEE